MWVYAQNTHNMPGLARWAAAARGAGQTWWYVANVSRIVAVAPALPEHQYSQSDITDALLDLVPVDNGRQAVMRRMHAASGIDTRHLVMPLEWYSKPGTFRAANDLFISAGTDLAERAIRAALTAAGVVASEIDFLLFTTVTGISAPSIDAGLIARLGMRQDVRRLPSFGLGCVAGAAGLARVHDYLVGHPSEIALLVSVELCSLTLQNGDGSMANVVASGLFGDGAAAVVLFGSERAARTAAPGPDIVDSRSRVYADTVDVIGWDVGDTGFNIVLSAGVPQVIDENFSADAADLLAAHALSAEDVEHWIAHPGGPRVLEAFARALALPDSALEKSWRSLAAVGNLSSASVLHVLADVLADSPAPGSNGLLFALGPGVSAELVLLHWPELPGTGQP